MDFLNQALAQLLWLNAKIEKTSGTERRALESARRELLELIMVANSAEHSSSMVQ
jgi:hypothetical protein